MSTVISTPRPTVLARARAEYRRRLVAAADRLHARGDELAREQGWTVTRAGTTRVYRAAEFDRIGGHPMICYVCRTDRAEYMFDTWQAECCLCASQTRSDRACRHQGQTAGSVRRTARDLLGADEHEAADALGVTVAQLRSLEEDTAAPDDAQIGAYACRLAMGVRIARVIA